MDLENLSRKAEGAVDRVADKVDPHVQGFMGKYGVKIAMGIGVFGAILFIAYYVL